MHDASLQVNNSIVAIVLPPQLHYEYYLLSAAPYDLKL